MRHVLAAAIVSAILTTATAAPSETLAQTPRLGEKAESPACDLLGTDDVRKITGRQEYGEGSTGDAPGEGLGGGTSCQWGRMTFMGENPPTVSVILVPSGKGKRYVDQRKNYKLAPGCKLDRVSGVGEEAFFEDCPKARELPLFVKARGENDLVVAMEIRAPATPDSAKPTIVALAKAALAKMR